MICGRVNISLDVSFKIRCNFCGRFFKRTAGIDAQSVCFADVEKKNGWHSTVTSDIYSENGRMRLCLDEPLLSVSGEPRV